MKENNKLNVKEIIAKKLFTHAFQPIYRLSNSQIAGFESLLRCQYETNPVLLFMYAIEQGCKNQLDMASIIHSVKRFATYQKNVNSYDLFLSVNVFPSTIVDPFFFHELVELFQNDSFSKTQIILEINEAERLTNLEKILEHISILKDKGVFIALDDFGKGEYSFQAVMEIAPHIIKLDRYFAQDLSGSTVKQRVLANILHCFGDHTELLLEGIETEKDLQCAQSLGVTYGQGYYLGKPQILHES